MKLHAVALRVDLALTAGACVAAGRERAAEALVESATRAGAPPLTFPRDAGGAPLPEHGWFWSQTHTRGLAAGVVAPAALGPVGIDAEWLDRPRLDAVRARFADELRVLESADDHAVLRLWTAKEALLKRFGVGIRDLRRARLVAVDGQHAWLDYRGGRHVVHQRVVGQHLLAVAASAEFRLEVTCARPPSREALPR